MDKIELHQCPTRVVATSKVKSTGKYTRVETTTVYERKLEPNEVAKIWELEARHAREYEELLRSFIQ